MSVPVIIHFWNQRPGKTLKVGSVLLIEEDAKEYKRSLKLSDLLLLLLRCLLIALLAIALSKPAWKLAVDTGKQKGWILMNREVIHETYTHFKPLIDSLQSAGLEFHYFNEAFQKEKLENALAIKTDSLFSKPVSYWSLATSLDQVIPGTNPVYLFTDNYLNHFSGARPTLSHHLNWSVYTADSATQITHRSNRDTGALTISIFTDKYSNDALYLKAAINAIQSFSKRSIKLSVVNNPKDISAQLDWLFWLSDQTLANNYNAKNVFSYEPGKVKSISSVVHIENTNPGSPPGLYKSVTANDNTRNQPGNIWCDGFGDPVLSHEKKDSASRYRFYSHFDPSWNELVWSDNFPAMIYNLLAKEKTVSGLNDANDNRIIDTKQLQPAYSQINEGRDIKLFTTINLSGISWLIIVILFFMERLVSLQNSKLKANG